MMASVSHHRHMPLCNLILKGGAGVLMNYCSGHLLGCSCDLLIALGFTHASCASECLQPAAVASHMAVHRQNLHAAVHT